MTNKKAKNKDRYEKALKFLEGHAKSKIERNAEEARKLLELNHGSGHYPSSYLLGYLYCVGLGGNYDRFEGIKLMKKFAPKSVEYFQTRLAENDDWAEFALGLQHYCGHFFQQDRQQGLELFKLSASHLNSYAENCLGLCYLDPRGDIMENELEAILSTPETDDANPEISYNANQQRISDKIIQSSDSSAFQHFSISAAKGNPLGQTNLGVCYLCGYGTKENDCKAFELFRDATVKHNFCRAQSKLGYLYQNGFFVKKNHDKTIKAYELAIAQNYPHAMNLLASYYFQDLRVFEEIEPSQQAKDLQNWTIEMLKRASALGHGPANFNLAYLYKIGTGVEKNMEKALELVIKAAKSKHAPASLELGSTYENGGLGAEINYDYAFNWYLEAANQKNLTAMLRVAQAYEVGDLVKQDLIAAKHFYRKAQNHRDSDFDMKQKANAAAIKIDDQLRMQQYRMRQQPQLKQQFYRQFVQNQNPEQPQQNYQNYNQNFDSQDYENQNHNETEENYENEPNFENSHQFENNEQNVGDVVENEDESGW